MFLAYTLRTPNEWLGHSSHTAVVEPNSKEPKNWMSAGANHPTSTGLARTGGGPKGGLPQNPRGFGARSGKLHVSQPLGTVNSLSTLSVSDYVEPLYNWLDGERSRPLQGIEFQHPLPAQVMQIQSPGFGNTGLLNGRNNG